MVASTDLSRRIMRDQALRAQAITRDRADQLSRMNQTLYPPSATGGARGVASDRPGAHVARAVRCLAEPLTARFTPGVAGYIPATSRRPLRSERAQRLMPRRVPRRPRMPPLRSPTRPVPQRDRVSSTSGARVLESPSTSTSGARDLPALPQRGETPFFPGLDRRLSDALYFCRVWHSSSAFNRARYRNPEFDRLTTRRRSRRQPARFALYHQAEPLLLDDWGRAALHPHAAAVGNRTCTASS